jgi:hypothetical protein
MCLKQDLLGVVLTGYLIEQERCDVVVPILIFEARALFISGWLVLVLPVIQLQFVTQYVMNSAHAK